MTTRCKILLTLTGCMTLNMAICGHAEESAGTWQQQRTDIIRKTISQAEGETSKQKVAQALGIVYPPLKSLASWEVIKQEVQVQTNAEMKKHLDTQTVRKDLEKANPMWKVGDKVRVVNMGRVYTGRLSKVKPSIIEIDDSATIHAIDFTDDVSNHVNPTKWERFITTLLAAKEKELLPIRKKIEQDFFEKTAKKYQLTNISGKWYRDEEIEVLVDNKRQLMVRAQTASLQKKEFTDAGFVWYNRNWYPKEVAEKMYAEAQERSKCRKCDGSGEVWETFFGSRWRPHSGGRESYMDRRAKCKECNGTGHVTFEYCAECDGSGSVYQGRAMMPGGGTAKQYGPCSSCNGTGKRK